MMTVKCPKCTTQLQFQPQAGAVRITCPKCATVMQVGQAPKSPLPPRPSRERMGTKGTVKLKTKRPKQLETPATAAPQQSPQAATPQAAAPQAAAAAGGFDLGNLDMPTPGGLDNAGVDPAGFGNVPGLPGAAALPPGHPALGKPKAAPKAGKPAPAKSEKPAKSGNKTALWVGLGVAGVLGTLTMGGLAFYLMGRSGTTVAQQSDPPAVEGSEQPTVPDDSPDPAGDANPEPAPSPDASSDVAASESDPSPESDPAPAAESAPAADPSPEPEEAPVVVMETPGDFQEYSAGNVSASFPPGKALDQLPTGIQGQAIRSSATKATLYVAVGKIDPEITDPKKIALEAQRLVMADIYPGEPCQRGNLSGFEGRLGGGLIYPSMELELYPTGGEIIIIGWGQPQHEVDLWTPLILQQKIPPLKFDKKKVEAEKAAFLQSVQIKG